MAFGKSQKRTASKAALKNKSGVAKHCRTLLSTVRSADNVPQPVKAMVCDTLTRTFGTYKESRHPLQAGVSALVGKIIEDAQGKHRDAINDAEHQKAVYEGEAASLSAANDAAAGASGAASLVLADSKAAVVAAKQACKDAKTALHDLAVQAKVIVADSATATTKKETLTAEGRNVAKVMAHHLEPELLAHVKVTYAKSAGAWGTFDNLVHKRVEEISNKVVGGLDSELATLASAKEANAAQIESAKAAVVATDEHAKAMEAAIDGATTNARDADAAAKAAGLALKPHQQHIDKAAHAVSHAQEALASFMKGPFAAYTELEARTAPPPAPEAATASSIDAAMEPAPAPAARTAPTVLPSPGVLSWVAQKSGLARSPEIAHTPQVASSPRR